MDLAVVGDALLPLGGRGRGHARRRCKRSPFQRKLWSWKQAFPPSALRGRICLPISWRRAGATSDAQVAAFLTRNLGGEVDLLELLGGIFGCSTLAAQTADGQQLFGRNFDWNPCEAMIVYAEPHSGYASVSTVNMSFNLGGRRSALPSAGRHSGAHRAVCATGRHERCGPGRVGQHDSG